ncbi:MAG: protein kinase [Deltaproteobacteria bacterium]|nr:protein kinase [Deltaproteobacteria bacterium]
MIGQIIAGRYKVDARLGEGGMGSVYRVEHTHMRKRLALKVLHREMTSQTEIVARFEREAMAAAHIEHPNVAGATDFGKLEDGSCYLVLEYVEGTSLRALIDSGPVSAARAVHVTVQILSALKRAHELGIVHRDLKPENVLLVDKEGEPDFVKVLDFGIARVPIGAIGGEAGPSLTRAGMVYGTPEYMAPEQALGQDVDGRSDQYSVGVMLFEMLVGKRPYDNKDKVALLGQHVAGPIPSVRARAPADAVSPELDAVVSRMLAKSPSDRHEDAAAAAEALMIASSGGPPLSSIEFRGEPSDPGRVVIDGTGPHAQLENGDTVRPPPFEPISAPVVRAGVALPLPRRTLVAMLAAVAALLVVIVVAATRAPAEGDGKGGAATDPKKSSAGAPTTKLSEGSKAKVQAALGRVTSGEIETGIKELEALSAEFPGDPVVHKALAQAYAQAKRHVDALSVIKKLLVAQPDLATDPFLDPIFDEALGSPAAVDTAFALLEGPMKAEGARMLYAIAYEGRGPQHLSARAKKSLADPEVAKAMSPALRGAIELRSAPFACNVRKEIIEKYKNDFDATALPALRAMTKTTGCGGFFKRSDCWPCLREDGLLSKVIASVEERSKK